MEDIFLNKDNFILAFQRLETAQRSSYKSMYLDDLKNFGFNLETNIETLIKTICDDTYEPSAAYKIYVPKSNGTVRPLTVISFVDLLVYQAIVNILAEELYDKFKYKYNKNVFGNIYNNSKSPDKRMFFYVQWKKQWKAYNKLSIKHFKDGFKYMCQFDLASFYDTIDHFMLLKFIQDDLKQQDKLIEVLEKQLNKWSCDYDRSSIYATHGIPQGPIASGFLAEIFLDYIDEKIISKKNKNRNIRYLRYVDDIRLFTKDEATGMRYLAYLDLLVRDIGLIPQASKFGIKRIENESEIRVDNKKISKIDNYYHINGKLKEKDNNKLIKSLKNSLIDEKIKNKSYDKTVLKFALYRIGPDDEIKNLLLSNIDSLYSNFEEVCYYLSKYYNDDDDVNMWLETFLNNKNIPYNYLVAIVFKYFYNSVEYSRKIYDLYYTNVDRKDWYVRYYLLDWIISHKTSILDLLNDDLNPHVQRKLLYYKYKTKDDIDAKLLILDAMMKDEDIQTAILGFNLYFELTGEINIEKTEGLNEFLRKVLDISLEENYITKTLKNKYGIENGKMFFYKDIWTDDELKFANMVFKTANTLYKVDPSSWLGYINTLNHTITVKILESNFIEIPNKKEFDNILELDGYIKHYFPRTYESFSKINNRRNELPSSHPYTRDGNIDKPLQPNERSRYEIYFLTAIKEIIEIYEGIYNENDKQEIATTQEEKSL